MTKNANVNTAATPTPNGIGFKEVDTVVRKRGEKEAERRLIAKFGVEGQKLWKQYFYCSMNKDKDPEEVWETTGAVLSTRGGKLHFEGAKEKFKVAADNYASKERKRFKTKEETPEIPKEDKPLLGLEAFEDNHMSLRQKMIEKFGVEKALKILGAYNALSKAKISPELKEKKWEEVLKVIEEPAPVAPEKEEGNVLFLKPYDWFITSEGKVIPPGLTVAYHFEGNDYSIVKTPKGKIQNIIKCYHNTSNELIKEKFEAAVTGYKYEDPVKTSVTPREFYRMGPVYSALRKSGEFVERQYDPLAEIKHMLWETKGFRPYSGSKDQDSQTELDKAEALLKAQKGEYEISHWGAAVLSSVKEIKDRMKENPLEAFELTNLIAESLGDMTDTEVHQKRCSEYLEDTHCDEESYELDYEKRAIRIAPKTREFCWALKRELIKAAEEVGANDYLKMLKKWAPTKSSRKIVDVKTESFKVARAIDYKEACDYYFQKTFGDEWKRELNIFLDFNAEGRNAYLASERVRDLITTFEPKRCFKYALQTALQDSTYDVFIDAYENFLHKELDLTIIRNCLRSTKLEEYEKTFSEFEFGYREAKITSLMQNSLILSSELKDLEDKMDRGEPINENRILSLQKQLENLSKSIEDLRDVNEKEEEEA